jgi:hypothetical protein
VPAVPPPKPQPRNGTRYCTVGRRRVARVGVSRCTPAVDEVYPRREPDSPYIPRPGTGCGVRGCAPPPTPASHSQLPPLERYPPRGRDPRRPRPRRASIGRPRTGSRPAGGTPRAHPPPLASPKSKSLGPGWLAARNITSIRVRGAGQQQQQPQRTRGRSLPPPPRARPPADASPRFRHRGGEGDPPIGSGEWRGPPSSFPRSGPVVLMALVSWGRRAVRQHFLVSRPPCACSGASCLALPFDAPVGAVCFAFCASLVFFPVFDLMAV